MAGLPPPPSHSHLPKVSLGFLTAWQPQQGSQHDCPGDKEQLSEEEARTQYLTLPHVCHILWIKTEAVQGSATIKRRPSPSPLPGRSIKVYVSTFNPLQTEFHCVSFHSACLYRLFTGICLALCRHGGYLCAYFSVKRERH